VWPVSRFFASAASEKTANGILLSKNPPTSVGGFFV